MVKSGIKTLVLMAMAFCLLLTSCSKEVPHWVQKRFVGKWKFVTVKKDNGHTEVHDYDGAEVQLNKDHTADYIDPGKNITMQGTWAISYRHKKLIRTQANLNLYHITIDLASPNGSQRLLINTANGVLDTKGPDRLSLYDSGWEYYLLKTID